MGSLGNLIFLAVGAAVGIGATVVVLSKKSGISITTLHPLPPGELVTFQSNIVQLKSVVLTHVNNKVSPALYDATLTYSDGSTNKNAVLYSTNIEDLVTIGVAVHDQIDNPQDIPSNDSLVIA